MVPKLKVLTIIGTRPEIIRLSEVIKELDRTTDHILVHTGQNYDYELNEVFFKDLGLRKPDHFLEVAGGTPAETVARVIERVDQVLEKERPEAVLVLGDTNSALGVYPAKRRKIPIFHMEAGNRSFDQRVPEEINRRIVDHISDINIVYTDRQRGYLLAEGFAPDRVIKSGSPMFEVLAAHEKEIDASNVLEKLEIVPGSYLIASFHREENISSEKNFMSIVEAMIALTKVYDKPIFVSTHPRTRKVLEEKGVNLPDSVHFLKPFGFFDYVKLQKNAFCVLSDSGTISEESSILNFAAVNVREAHERPESMDEANVVLTGISTDRILQAVAITVSYRTGLERDFHVPGDYMVPNVSKKVVKVILSYTDYVNCRVWMKA